MPQHAPCRNRTYNLVHTDATGGERFPSENAHALTLLVPSRTPKKREIGTQCATDVQSGVLPHPAIRRGWRFAHLDAPVTPEAA